MIKFYSAFIRNDKLCFDIGANRGTRTEALAALGARVIAVEPLPVCCELLKINFGKANQVTIVQKAVSCKKGTGKIYAGIATTISTMNLDWQKAVRASGRFREHTWNDAVEVETITLDDLIVEFGVPDFCKIDVEGHEHSVLLGLSSPIGLISYEFTPEMIGEAKKCLVQISKLGRYEYNLSLGESMKFHFRDWECIDGMTQILTEISERSDAFKTFGDVYARQIK